MQNHFPIFLRYLVVLWSIRFSATCPLLILALGFAIFGSFTRDGSFVPHSASWYLFNILTDCCRYLASQFDVFPCKLHVFFLSNCRFSRWKYSSAGVLTRMLRSLDIFSLWIYGDSLRHSCCRAEQVLWSTLTSTLEPLGREFNTALFSVSIGGRISFFISLTSLKDCLVSISVVSVGKCSLALDSDFDILLKSSTFR